jgi:Ca-activated chloride channel family protein
MAANRRIFLFLAASSLVCTARAPLAQTRRDLRIVANVELVQIPVIVFDDKGAVAANLKKDDFRVLEDGVEQQLVYCERERESVSFVILADQSESMTKKIPFVQEAALSLVDPGLPKDPFRDEYSVFGIESRAKRLVPFTRDQHDLERRLPLLLTPTKGRTALFDGIYLGVASAQSQAENKRRAVIIISDGGDNNSRYNLRETQRLLEEADMPVFAVMAAPSFDLSNIFYMPESKPKSSPWPGTKSQSQSPGSSLRGSGDDYIGPDERRGPHNLKALTEVTGGGVFTAHSLEDLPRVVRTIGLAVRYRYVLTYRPAGKAKARAVSVGENIWHKIHVELRPKEKFAGYGIPYYKRGYNRID